MHNEAIINAVKSWVERFVVGESLCPFARRPLEAGRVRFAVTGAQSETALLESLTDELVRLSRQAALETTLLIHPNVLNDFLSYNQFLDEADALVRSLNMEGVVQVASFHPDYQFAGTKPGDAGNYTNRSPYPLLHLIREESIEAASRSFAGIENVPDRNIRHLQDIGTDALAERLQACLRDSTESFP